MPKCYSFDLCDLIVMRHALRIGAAHAASPQLRRYMQRMADRMERMGEETIEALSSGARAAA